MKREILSQALNMLDERFIVETAAYEPGVIQETPERTEPMKTKRFISIALAAALILALAAAAYAVWSIHEEEQQELRENLQIAENNAESYLEFGVPDGQKEGLVLLSTVNDGSEQRVYVNVSPVTEEEAAAFPEDVRFVWSIEGTDIGGSAAPQLPVELSLSGAEEIRAAVLEHAYDKDSQTLTLQCFIDVEMFKKAAEELGVSSAPLSVSIIAGGATRSFGPVSLSLTQEQRRDFDFGGAVFHDAELDRDIELVGLELTPFSAVWKVRYEGAAAFHTPGADPDAYGPWSILEDRVCIESKLVFSDGTEFSTGGALTCPYENGTVMLTCSWGSAINIDNVERIVLGDLILWEAE